MPLMMHIREMPKQDLRIKNGQLLANRPLFPRIR